MSWKYYSKKKLSNEKLYTILRAPIITEKMTFLSKYNQFGFYVLSTANKKEVRQAVESLFHVKVKKVNILNQFGKRKVFKQIKGRRSDYKKAIVHLSEGNVIDFESGVV